MILPAMISPLKGRNTTRRNSTAVHQRSANYPRGAHSELAVNIHGPSAVTDKAIRGSKKVIDTDAKSNLLDHLKGSGQEYRTKRYSGFLTLFAYLALRLSSMLSALDL